MGPRNSALDFWSLNTMKPAELCCNLCQTPLPRWNHDISNVEIGLILDLSVLSALKAVFRSSCMAKALLSSCLPSIYTVLQLNSGSVCKVYVQENALENAFQNVKIKPVFQIICRDFLQNFKTCLVNNWLCVEFAPACIFKQYISPARSIHLRSLFWWSGWVMHR